MTHPTVPRNEREEAGITDELVRISVGCEDYDDLKDDLDGALNQITERKSSEALEAGATIA
jgi:cystathionine beta-lyase/cystathionine gamma-synthase